MADPGHDLAGLRARSCRGNGLRARTHLGNHINPAVTLGLAVTGQVPLARRCPHYIAAQVLGAMLGAATILGVLGQEGERGGARRRLATAATSAATQAFFAEFVGTFILVFTVFGVIHRKAAAGFGRRSRSAWSCSRRSSRWRPPPARRSTRRAPSARCSSSRSPAAACTGASWPVYLHRRTAGGCPRRRSPTACSPAPPA